MVRSTFRHKDVRAAVAVDESFRGHRLQTMLLGATVTAAAGTLLATALTLLRG